jgi:tellurite resistance protein TerC
MFETPSEQVNKALLYGIGAAGALRLVFFIIGSSLFEWVSWIRIPFGLLLLWTAYKTMKAAHSESKLSIEHSPVLEWAEGNLPFTKRYDKSGKFFQRDNSSELMGVETTHAASGRLVMTMLGAVVATLAVVDVLFALDAVAAKVAQTQDLYVNFTSSLFAMVALRSLYFVIAELTVAFKLLKYGVALVLAFVAVELILSMWIHIPSAVSCIIILAICGSSILASVCMSAVVPAKPSQEVELAEAFGMDEQSPIIQGIPISEP